MEVEGESSHTKVTHVWEPGKCIPQASVVPKYVVNSLRVAKQTQYMKDHALIGNFLGLWPFVVRSTQMDQHLVETQSTC
jgi:hypothetical protein